MRECHRARAKLQEFQISRFPRQAIVIYDHLIYQRVLHHLYVEIGNQSRVYRRRFIYDRIDEQLSFAAQMNHMPKLVRLIAATENHLVVSQSVVKISVEQLGQIALKVSRCYERQMS